MQDQNNQDSTAKLIESKKQQLFRQLRIGEHLVQRKVITIAQLAEALEEQDKTKELIGQLLVKKGFLTQDKLKEALDFQDKTYSYVLSLIKQINEDIEIKLVNQ